jgi:hypothetical protein
MASVNSSQLMEDYAWKAYSDIILSKHYWHGSFTRLIDEHVARKYALLIDPENYLSEKLRDKIIANKRALITTHQFLASQVINKNGQEAEYQVSYTSNASNSIEKIAWALRPKLPKPLIFLGGKLLPKVVSVETKILAIISSTTHMLEELFGEMSAERFSRRSRSLRKIRRLTMLAEDMISKTANGQTQAHFGNLVISNGNHVSIEIYVPLKVSLPFKFGAFVDGRVGVRLLGRQKGESTVDELRNKTSEKWNIMNFPD